MAEYVFNDSNLMSRHKNRRKRRDVSEPIPMQSVPAYQLPQELVEVLKQNINHYPGISDEGKEWLSCLKILPEMKDIEEANYLTTLRLLLYLEDYYNEEEKDLFVLRNQIIRRSDCSLDHFVIKVPGLAEDHLIPTDVIEVHDLQDPRKYNLEVTLVVENYVTVKGDPTFLSIYSDGLRFDVMFQRSNWPIRACHFGLKMINNSSLSPLLNPVAGEYCNKPKVGLFWFDENIKNNPEQMQAVQRILGRTACPSPYLVFGPPGTGKTATIVEAISQIWKSDPLKSRILVCTPSNAAADEIARRLLRNMSQYLICRMNSPSRDKNDIDESIRGCSHFLLTKELLVRKKIIITTLITCVRLVRMDFWQNHFGYIFIDEAAQATQPETLIPLGLLSPENKGFIGKFEGQLVLSGDPKQLGPIVSTKIGQHLLGKSMLERLMDRVKLYQKGEDNKYDPNFITKLLNNYRSHEAILHLPNRMFYENELVACGGHEITRAEYWSQLPNKKFPLIFHAVHGSERRDENSPSVYNQYEVDVVVNYVSTLMVETLGGHKIEENDIGIVTPFKFQASIIKKALQQRGWHDIAVGTVEIFQGQEKDIIIISTVRSIVYQHYGRFHLGFLSHEKRFNVTITRAKSLLIVVGNPKILQIDPCWREFIEYCKRNRACKGDNFTLSPLSEGEMKTFLNNKMETEECEENLLIPEVNGTLESKLDIDSSTNISTNFLPVEERLAAAKERGETLNDWW